jgi:Rod binding domain-containing protein
MISAVNTLAAGAGSADEFKAGKNANGRLGEAARQFEALLLAQMLKSARQASAGGPAGETDASSGCAMEYAEEQVAALLAQRGGLGIANVLVAGLQKEQSAANAAQEADGSSSPAGPPRS